MVLIIATSILFLYLTNFVQSQQKDHSHDLRNTYEKCQETLGNPSWLCDPDGKLKSKDAVASIDDWLWRLQTDVPCYCSDGQYCYRYSNISIQSGVVGLLIVTTYLPDNIDDVARDIYDDADLARSPTNCDNGLLIIYAADGQKIYAYRGNSTQQILLATDSDANLNRLTESLQNQDYRYALPTLLEQYVLHLQGRTYERQHTWEAIVGICVAVAIVAFAAAVIFGLCFARYCAKKKSLSRPPPPPLFREEEEKMKTALRRVKRRQNRALARHKARLDKTQPLGGQISPKRAASARRRLNRKQNRKQRKIFDQQQQQRALLTPSSASEEQYYLISEPPSTIYAPYAAQTTMRAGGNGGTESPYATGTLRPPSAGGGYQPPAILYPDSQAVFNQQPSPKRETQRRDFYVYDEEENKEIYDSPTVTTTHTTSQR